MHYANEAVIAALKAARESGGLSQRDLSAKAGVPQSHISKIEGGGADIRLSSLIELARALELDLVLVPRHLVPAVEGVLRAAPLPQPESRSEHKELERAAKALGKIARQQPKTEWLDRLRQILRELGHFRLSTSDLTTVDRAAQNLAALADGKDDGVSISEIRNSLQNLRNRIAHAVPAPPQPAYSLEENDDA
ncbi:Helix-turn-helix [Bosea lupini]|uniref:Helix-turn-helix n=1 Tax=Bosea lupini TaxID=1036779 RepID=A0A1H7WEH9_9HYPH|nr:helix-turn-helix transcriptional regulator [Bosea lupini]SEM19744.1 Helix-turn-helix [Bosea lupini]